MHERPIPARRLVSPEVSRFGLDHEIRCRGHAYVMEATIHRCVGIVRERVLVTQFVGDPIQALGL
jgi:hypothetical protein